MGRPGPRRLARLLGLFRGVEGNDRHRAVVEYPDLASGARRKAMARTVFLGLGASARLEGSSFGGIGMQCWRDGLLTTLQYRVYLDRPAAAIAYRSLELHYYNYKAPASRPIDAWMFPKRDHLAIGLGLNGKIDGAELRTELDAFTSARASAMQRASRSGSWARRHIASL